MDNDFDPKSFFSKKREYSYLGLLQIALALVIRILVLLLFFWIAHVVSEKQGFLDFLSTSPANAAAVHAFKLFFFVSVIIAILDYSKDMYEKSTWKDVQKNEIIIYGTLAGAVKRVAGNGGTSVLGQQTNSTEFLLHTVESISKVVLGKSEADGITICAYIMLPFDNSNILRTSHWGTKLDGREDFDIVVGEDGPMAGASRAFTEKQPAYSEDKSSSQLDGVFGAKKNYPTVLSIPIMENPDQDIVGVLNIDSTLRDAFRTKDFIRKSLLPKLMPIVHLLRIELLNQNQHFNS